ncbi:TerD family protein [Streptomyces sp. DSM 41014]|uniref:TerD family protein n=1 Tax=Streptomyces hintoniae TaxID=3075521 RepID=A0ABU2UFV6_9ACTN|nr:TerD family protein [Streptomyces sp. DSM 41014]MDT0472144.1 TerD family protein [Streptomyces sp. DSM 41014]
MTAELTRGQNHPLSQVRLEIRISAGSPVVAAVAIGDEHGTVRGWEGVAHPGAPALPGLEVPKQAATAHRLAVDLGAMPESAHRLSVLLALPAGAGVPARFGAVAAPFVAVTGLDGTELATFTLTGLDTESAVVALELYRRQGAWKVRAVGQGYAGGLAALLADQGLPDAVRLADTVHEAVAQGLARSVAAPPRQRTADGDRTRHSGAPQLDQAPAPRATSPYGPQDTPPGAPDTSSAVAPPSAPAAGGPVDYTHPGRRATAPPPPPAAAPPPPAGQHPQPVAGDANGWSMDERLYNQVWGMFEDLARTTAAYRSAVDFADSRQEKELDQVLSDPRSRIGGQGDAVREAARARHAELVDRARAALDRDLAQLAAESDVVEPALPPAYARWDNPVWHGYRVPMELPMAVRLGDLRLPESGPLRIPMLVRLPLERGLWIDSGRTGVLDESFADPHRLRRLALDTAVAVAARLLAVYPAHEFAVQVIDPAGTGREALAPLVGTGALAAPPALGAGGVAEVLGRLTRRVDLVQMAVRGGAADSLPPEVDTAEQLLIVNDFPHGFDDRAVTQLRYLADEGPAVGVHLLMVADREDADGYGPLLDPLWRSLMRLTPVADDHLADPWVGHAWTYEPALVPPGSEVLQQVLARVAAARTKY